MGEQSTCLQTKAHNSPASEENLNIYKSYHVTMTGKSPAKQFQCQRLENKVFRLLNSFLKKLLIPSDLKRKVIFWYFQFLKNNPFLFVQ